MLWFESAPPSVFALPLCARHLGTAAKMASRAESKPAELEPASRKRQINHQFTNFFFEVIKNLHINQKCRNQTTRQPRKPDELVACGLSSTRGGRGKDIATFVHNHIVAQHLLVFCRHTSIASIAQQYRKYNSPSIKKNQKSSSHNAFLSITLHQHSWTVQLLAAEFNHYRLTTLCLDIQPSQRFWSPGNWKL